MENFLSGFRGFRDWHVTREGNVVSLGRSAKGTATIFRFAGAKPLLHEVWIKLKDSELHWSYSFGSGASVSSRIPTDARTVSAFTVRGAPPKFATPEAEKIVQKMIKAYGALQNGMIAVESDEGNSKLILSGRRLRQDGAHFTWAYDGSVLSMRNGRSGAFYRGKAIRVILSEYVAKAGGDVDPIIRSVLAHRVPYFELFPTGASVRVVGEAGGGEHRSHIVEVATPVLKVSLFVREDNHLLDSTDSETVDRPGRVQTRHEHHFTYTHLGSTTPLSEFHLSPGIVKTLPLPSIKTVGLKG